MAESNNFLSNIVNKITDLLKGSSDVASTNNASKSAANSEAQAPAAPKVVSASSLSAAPKLTSAADAAKANQNQNSTQNQTNNQTTNSIFANQNNSATTFFASLIGGDNQNQNTNAQQDISNILQNTVQTSGKSAQEITVQDVINSVIQQNDDTQNPVQKNYTIQDLANTSSTLYDWLQNKTDLVNEQTKKDENEVQNQYAQVENKTQVNLNAQNKNSDKIISEDEQMEALMQTTIADLIKASKTSSNASSIQDYIQGTISDEEIEAIESTAKEIQQAQQFETAQLNASFPNEKQSKVQQQDQNQPQQNELSQDVQLQPAQIQQYSAQNLSESAQEPLNVNETSKTVQNVEQKNKTEAGSDVNINFETQLGANAETVIADIENFSTTKTSKTSDTSLKNVPNDEYQTVAQDFDSVVISSGTSKAVDVAAQIEASVTSADTQKISDGDYVSKTKDSSDYAASVSSVGTIGSALSSDAFASSASTEFVVL